MQPIELLTVSKSTLNPVTTPPHPSTLKTPNSHKPTRTNLPFSHHHTTSEEKVTSVLLDEIIRPLEDLDVVSDPTASAMGALKRIGSCQSRSMWG